MKKPKYKYQWAGLLVKSTVPLKNSQSSLPVGTLYTVVRSHNGLHLQSTPCDCCGGQQYITRVPEREVEIIKRLYSECKHGFKVDAYCWQCARDQARAGT